MGHEKETKTSAYPRKKGEISEIVNYTRGNLSVVMNGTGNVIIGLGEMDDMNKSEQNQQRRESGYMIV